ncbi:MAG: hypothetical protein H0V42_02910 [Nocardioidaceae bacterium]|nr:hypothetical protein [Nocardioidaceae bacterium]
MCGSDAAQYVGWADVVLEGTVESREGPRPKPIMSSGDLATYTVTVDEVFKGETSRVVAVTSADSGASCGLENIRIGGDYLVFAGYAQHGTLTASLCGGTAKASPAFVSAVESVTGPGTAQPDDEGTGAAEAPPPKETTVASGPGEPPASGAGPSGDESMERPVVVAGVLLITGSAALALRRRWVT